MKKIENEFKFLNTPKFSYEYKNEVNVLGRKLIHIGDGIFMFEEPFVSDELSLDQFVEKLEDYKDIAFIRFYTYAYDGYDEKDKSTWGILFADDLDKKKWIIPFAVSRTHRRHTAEAIDSYVRKYMAGFHIPDSMLGIIKNIVENYMENDNAHHSSYEEVYYKYKEYIYDHRPADVECTHLLDFEHNTDDGRYVFVSGFAGRKILDGIYYFDDSVSLADNERMKMSDYYYEMHVHRLCSDDLNPDDFKENIAFVGEEIWNGGTIAAYGGTRIFYIAFGDSAIDVLHRLYKNLSGYEMRGMKKDAVRVKIEPVDIMAELEEYEKKESSRPTIDIPESACELIEGMGFHNIDVRCKLLFQDTGIRDTTNDRGFSKYDVAYIMDDKLYLINYNVNQEKEEGYALSLRMVKELSVRYRARLFDHVEEDIVQVVIDNGNAEKSILGEEDYSSYLKFVTEKRNG